MNPGKPQPAQPMTGSRRAALRAQRAAATPGTLARVDGLHACTQIAVQGFERTRTIAAVHPGATADYGRANAEYLAAAANAFPDALDALDAVEAERDSWRARALAAEDHRASPAQGETAIASAVAPSNPALLDIDHLAADVAAHLDRLGVQRTAWIWVAKVAEEAGEVLGALIKRTQGRCTDTALYEELGDVFLSALGAADQLGLIPSALITWRWAQVLPRSTETPGITPAVEQSPEQPSTSKRTFR